MNTISILGCGWLGLPLGQALANEGYQVKGSTTRSEQLGKIAAAGIMPYLIKVGEQLEGVNTADFFQSDLLFLNIPPGGRRDPEVETTYPLKVRAIAEAAAQGGVQQLVFVSSTSVYGDDGDWVDEGTALAPSTASGRALEQIEGYLHELGSPQATVLRMAGLAGGSRRPGRFLAGKTDLPNGEAPVNLVHLEDCIGIVKALIEQRAFGHTFNVVADEHPSRAELYTAQAKQEGLAPPTFVQGPATAFKLVSNERVKEALGYTFLHPDPMDF